MSKLAFAIRTLKLRVRELIIERDDARAVASRLALFIETRTIDGESAVDTDVVKALEWVAK